MTNDELLTRAMHIYTGELKDFMKSDRSNDMALDDARGVLLDTLDSIGDIGDFHPLRELARELLELEEAI